LCAIFFNFNEISDKCLRFFFRYFSGILFRFPSTTLVNCRSQVNDLTNRPTFASIESIEFAIEFATSLVVRLDTDRLRISSQCRAASARWEETTRRASGSKSESHCAVVYSRGGRVRDAG